MSNSPKNSRPRYQKIRELGRNRAEGRVTYLATDTITGQPVVIKQFQFATSGSDWSAFKAYEREIQVLAALNHPGIPRYLNSFETPSGFCLVQEYKDAQPLTVPRPWTAQEIHYIGFCILEILEYLQSRIPPVIHRDIKPENILVDDQLNFYLVDFGLARIGTGEGAISSVAAGTFGFMAPEQLYNRQLTMATDVYGLGATLICLLTETKSTEIETLIDDTGRINCKGLADKLNPRFINWLEKMVQPKQKERYASATEAKAELISLDVTPVPKVQLTPNSLEFKAAKLGDKVTQIITVSNPIPKTRLEGWWEVSPHPNDPPHSSSTHPWIFFTPNSFKQNQIDCSITVDTSNLIADKVYSRQILLKTNSEPPTHSLTVKVYAGSLPIIPRTKLYDSLASLIIGILLLAFSSYVTSNYMTIYSQLFLGRTPEERVGFFFVAVFFIVATIGAVLWSTIGAIVGFHIGIASIAIAIFVSWLLPTLAMNLVGWRMISRDGQSFGGVNFFSALLAILFATLVFFMLGNLFGLLLKEQKKAGFSLQFSILITVLATALGCSLGIGLRQGFQNSFVVFIELVLSLLLVITMHAAFQQPQKLMDEYRKSKLHRIKP